MILDGFIRSGIELNRKHSLTTISEKVRNWQYQLCRRNKRRAVAFRLV